MGRKKLDIMTGVVYVLIGIAIGVVLCIIIEMHKPASTLNNNKEVNNEKMV